MIYIGNASLSQSRSHDFYFFHLATRRQSIQTTTAYFAKNSSAYPAELFRFNRSTVVEQSKIFHIHRSTSCLLAKSKSVSTLIICGKPKAGHKARRSAIGVKHAAISTSKNIHTTKRAKENNVNHERLPGHRQTAPHTLTPSA